MRENRKIRVGISIGDINGVGIEIVLKTLNDNRMIDFCTPIIFGSNKIISEHRKILDLHDIGINIINDMSGVSQKKPNLLNIWEKDIKITLGKPSTEAGEYSLKSLETACDSLKNKEIDVLVTAPINKSNIQRKVKDFIGHTEFLENCFSGKSLMVMVSNIMKISFITGHIPLSQVKQAINIETIINKTTLLKDTLITDFSIRSPKIALLGINPHAGENGALGIEEKEIIIPAISKLNKQKVLAYGPYPADSFFTKENIKKFDGIIAMYHDQGLIPFKTLSFFEGVNYTAGLNIIRTSPVHGTAYEIAGKGKADEKSFRNAIFLACDIYKERSRNLKLKKDSLNKSDKNK